MTERTCECGGALPCGIRHCVEIRSLRAERDAAIAARDEAVARLVQLREVCSVEQLRELTTRLFAGEISFGRLLEEIRSSILGVFDAKEAAERARDEVGLQYAAAQAEIARMRPVVEAARTVSAMWLQSSPRMSDFHITLSSALRALDAVPGDALAREVERTTRFEVNVLNTDIAKVIADALVEAYGQLVEVDLVEGGCSLSGFEVAHVEAATRVLGDAVERVRAAGHVEDDKAPTELFPEGGRQ